MDAKLVMPWCLRRKVCRACPCRFRDVQLQDKRRRSSRIAMVKSWMWCGGYILMPIIDTNWYQLIPIDTNWYQLIPYHPACFWKKHKDRGCLLLFDWPGDTPFGLIAFQSWSQNCGFSVWYFPMNHRNAGGKVEGAGRQGLTGRDMGWESWAMWFNSCWNFKTNSSRCLTDLECSKPLWNHRFPLKQWAMLEDFVHSPLVGWVFVLTMTVSLCKDSQTG